MGRETGWILLTVGVLVGARLVAGFKWPVVYQFGLSLSVWSVATAVPLMIVYHIFLWRFLRLNGIHDPDWYRHPLSYNRQLREHGDWSTLLTCYAAGAGFVAIMVGLALLGYSLFLGYVQIDAETIGLVPG